MRRILILAIILSPFLSAGLCSKTKEPKAYESKNGDRIVISAIRKRTKDGAYVSYKSRIVFYSAKNEEVCSLDYTSEDAEHGFGVVKAAWTPDNNYFVFSLTSSGGHQAWHSPTLFYDPCTGEIHSLDNYAATGISKGYFGLKAPNVVLTEVWRGEEGIPVRFRLDSLVSIKHKAQHPMLCSGGNLLQPER